jgi:hypothetical protein
MPKLITVKTHTDSRGSLSVVQKEIGFPIKRVFYIYNVNETRGGHGHKRTKTALIALNGSVVVSGQSPKEDFSFTLKSPDQVLLLEVEDWHVMSFGPGSILLVLASEEYQADDYFYEKYRP